MKLKPLIVLLLCALCTSALPLSAQQSAPTGAPAPGAYVIQPNDILSVFVFSHPELSLKVVVQPDGLISIPLAQSIQAAGLTPAQLKVTVEKRMTDSRLIDAPDVTVTLDAIQSYRIFVTGKVQKQGLLSYETPLTVLQAIAMAGGLAEYAKKDQITIIRTSNTPSGMKNEKIPFNYDDVYNKNDSLKQNILLKSGDVIVVP